MKALRRPVTNEWIAVDACANRMYGVPMAPTQRSLAPARARRRPIQVNALRAFEAASRRLSFTLAADELALTQSSISRQIAGLERQVGKALFVRQTRALALTADGARLQVVVSQALASIDRSVAEIRDVGQRPRVSLSTYASFASLWLVPRLAAFQQLHPQIEIRIDASDRSVDLLAEGIDIAIRRCLPAHVPRNAAASELCEEFVTPALSPHLLERLGRGLNSPADLRHLPHIEMNEQWPSARASSWTRWFELAGVATRSPCAGQLTFSFIDQAVQAAIRGQGVVMGRSPLVEEAVAAGQLATPFGAIRLATGYRYYLLLHPERAEAAEVAAFARWVREEFERGPQRFS